MRRARNQHGTLFQAQDDSDSSSSSMTDLEHLVYGFQNTNVKELQQTIKQLQRSLSKTKQQCKAALHEAASTKIELERKTRQEAQFKSRLQRLAEYEKQSKHNRIAESEAIKELEYINATLSNEVATLKQSLRKSEQKHKQRIAKFSESLRDLEDETSREREIILQVAKGVHLTSIDLQRHLGSHGFHAVPSQVAKTLLDALVSSSANLLAACGTTQTPSVHGSNTGDAHTTRAQQVMSSIITPEHTPTHSRTNRHSATKGVTQSPRKTESLCSNCVSLRHKVQVLQSECDSLNASNAALVEDNTVKLDAMRSRYRDRIAALQNQCKLLEGQLRSSEQRDEKKELYKEYSDLKLQRRHEALVKAITSIKSEAKEYRERVFTELLSSSQIKPRSRSSTQRTTGVDEDWQSAMSSSSPDHRRLSHERHNSVNALTLSHMGTRVHRSPSQETATILKRDLEALDDEIAELQHALFARRSGRE